ncbi:MAG: type II secretion system protein GspM [Candidatus Omnitrophota bacterium]|nr:type II secretion system protein GspM [Candidatus Omnitrophota bacterium]
MTVRWRKSRRSLKGYLPWAALFVAPLAINLLVWAALVRPPQQQRHRWQDARSLAELKPKLDGLLAESHRMLMDAERTGFTSDDPSSVTQAIDRLAGRHRVTLGKIDTKQDQSKGLGDTALSLTVDVRGRFSKLAHWMSEVEAQSGLQIDFWTISSGEKPGDLHTLTVNLTAFLRGV